MWYMYFYVFWPQEHSEKVIFMIRTLFNPLKPQNLNFGHIENTLPGFKGLNISLSNILTPPLCFLGQNIVKHWSYMKIKAQKKFLTYS